MKKLLILTLAVIFVMVLGAGVMADNNDYTDEADVTVTATVARPLEVPDFLIEFGIIQAINENKTADNTQAIWGEEGQSFQIDLEDGLTLTSGDTDTDIGYTLTVTDPVADNGSYVFDDGDDISVTIQAELVGSHLAAASSGFYTDTSTITVSYVD